METHKENIDPCEDITKEEQEEAFIKEAERLFIWSFNILSKLNHQRMVEKGFWDDRKAIVEACKGVSPELAEAAQRAVDCQQIALMHSELSEAVEGMRHNSMDDKIPEFTSIEAEIADVFIRGFDYAGGRGLRIAEAIIAKMNMNTGRTHKHGKAF